MQIVSSSIFGKLQDQQAPQSATPPPVEFIYIKKPKKNKQKLLHF